MGYNTAVLVCNDAVHMIENDATFAKNFAGMVYRASSIGFKTDLNQVTGGPNVHMNVNGHSAAVVAIAPRHADQTQIVLVGNNTIERFEDQPQQAQIELLKELADRVGYRLAKKPTRK